MQMLSILYRDWLFWRWGHLFKFFGKRGMMDAGMRRLEKQGELLPTKIKNDQMQASITMDILLET